MGIGRGIFVFLRPPYHGGKDRVGRPGSKEKEIEFERYPSFQNRDAHALRFGSMNSISRFYGREAKILGPFSETFPGGTTSILSHLESFWDPFRRRFPRELPQF